jgi:pyruvate formate lyase activating enzyme
MYAVSGGAIVERFPHRWSSCGTSLIESSPFYHVYPGSRCLVIGTTSCNFRCLYCSNAYIAKEDPELQQGRMYQLTPRELVGVARKLDCRSIVFSVNEPTVSLPSLLDVAQEAKAAAIPMGCLSNGYTTVESTELLASVFSFFNISLKGISASFNRTYIGIPSSGPVLRNIARLAQDRHVEVTTPIIQGANDNEIDSIAGFLAEVDPEIPWHVFRLLPEDQMKGMEYPSIQAIDEALQSARKKLPYIYFHNFVGSEWVNTLCPACGTVVIERFSLGCGGDKLNRSHCIGDRCPRCGRQIKVLSENACLGSPPSSQGEIE